MVRSIPEPNFAQACEWWPDLPSIWTPIGWPDHMFRFNVLWNGTILAEPNLNSRTTAWAGQGVQVTFAPGVNEAYNEWHHGLHRNDDALVKQGWNADAAPVLWSEWSQDGLLYRQEAFAHVPGAKPVETGIEPLFAWVRVSVWHLCPALPLEDTAGCNIVIELPHVRTTMEMRNNLRFSLDKARYPRKLTAEPAAWDAAQGMRLIEDDPAGGTPRVRIALAPAKDATATFTAPADDKPNHPFYRVFVRMPAKKGAHVDILVPMLPADRETFDRELALGYDAALRETNRFWAQKSPTAAAVSVPEPFINDAIRHSVRFSRILSEKNPATGKYCKINGSFTYAALWTTPGSMDLAMMMDTLGWHDVVERYLHIFREEQGTVKPPGNAFSLHPGYLSTPAAYKSIDWLSDNGAVLYTLATHGLLSGSRAFTEQFTDSIVKSCEWIRDVRALKGHGGYEGVLPPAVATDAGTKIQSLWSIGWNYKGLCAAVRLLKRAGHPRAAEFEREAADYRTAFLAALRDKCKSMPAWKDAKGRKHRFVPTALAGDAKSESRHAFYLDTGPLFPVFAGLMDAADPLMDDVRLWFREGPQWQLYRRDSNCWQVPVLDREMSSCEPCYSWNVFHSWQQGDRARFLEGMYSLFAGSISRKTFISCETRGGITGNVFAAPLAIYMARLAMIDDQLREGELHLLRLMPLAWLKPGDACRFDKLPTEFGPVTLRTECSKNGKTLDVTFKPKFHTKPERIVLHVPPADGLATIRVNGKAIRAKGRVIEIA